MGRKKIKIARINDDRNRSVTYLKRKAGLMKKAHELAVLTGSEVAVIVFGQNGKLTEFCSGDMDRVLLRYTEHNGPVERKGPEHYSNDDDDGSDEEGGDLDEGEGGEGSGGIGGASGLGGPPDQYSPTANGGDKGQSEDSKNNKRKAPNGHRMKEGNHSMSSTHSSKRGSPPYSAPIIKVEGDTDNVAIDGSVQKGALKAAIIQRSISKPGSHERSGSSSSRPHTGTHSAKSMSGPEMSMLGDNGNLQMSNMPLRPYTSGGMADMHPSLSPGMLAQQHQRQQATSPRFAYSNDQSNANQGMNPFLQPQAVWADQNGSPQLMRGNSGQTANSTDVSYGDLARGGSSRPHSPYKMQHEGSVSPNPSQSAFNPAQNYASLQLPQQSLGNTSLLPLAHPVLRQHPQYESYTNQLRVQQQQYLASRSGSHPISSAHTAPSSPNHLMVEDHSAFSNGLGVTASDPTLVRRSASFGYMEGHPDRRDFQQTLNQNQFQFVSPFDTSGVGRRATSQQPPHQYNHNAKDLTSSFTNDGDNAMQPAQFGHLDASSSQNPSEPSISNAAFNDLMGSILSDMESTGNSVSSTTGGGGNLEPTEERSKEQEEVLLSMESDASLSTLVNSESFDVQMASGSDPTAKAEDSSASSVIANKKKAKAGSSSTPAKSRKS